MKKIRLWCDHGSNGLTNLKIALQAAGVDCKRIKINSTTYTPRADHIIINWGNSKVPQFWDNTRAGIQVNSTLGVATAANKLRAFEVLACSGISIPECYDRKQDALQEILDGAKIFCRTKLTGHSGAGIVIARTPEELVDAPLYTEAIDNGGEWRVHIFRNLHTNELQVIDIVKKRRRTELMEQEDGINADIRNLAGGWVYCHNNVSLPDSVLNMAKAAITNLGLDFGAVDIIRKKNTDRYYILEVNTAPGLESETTINAYVNIIKEGVNI